jgi:hypothetical protein
MGKRNLPPHDRIAVADVRQEIVQPMLQFDIHPHSELLDIKQSGTPLDADPFSNPARLLGGETSSDPPSSPPCCRLA